jgi:hypothetical protein
VTIVKLAAGVCDRLFVRVLTIALSLAAILLGNFAPPLVTISAFFLILVSAVWIEEQFGVVREREEFSALEPCEHSAFATTLEPRSKVGCEECVKNNYKWVHLRLCLECGHVGCCDSSSNRHATKHYQKTDHAIMASLEAGESWAWCYTDERFVPMPKKIG